MLYKLTFLSATCGIALLLSSIVETSYMYNQSPGYIVVKPTTRYLPVGPSIFSNVMKPPRPLQEVSTKRRPEQGRTQDGKSFQKSTNKLRGKSHQTHRGYQSKPQSSGKSLTKTSGQVLTKTSGQFLTKTSGKVLTGTSGKVLTGTSGKVSTGTSGKVLTGISGKVLTGTSDKVLTGTSVKNGKTFPSEKLNHNSHKSKLEKSSIAGNSVYKDQKSSKSKHDAKPYKFSYGVYDSHYGTNYGHSESRAPKTSHVTGEYFVHLPDGRIQRVSYYTDDWGYHPTVTYEGKAQYS